MTRNTRIALLGVAVVIIVVAVIVIGGGGSDDTKASGPTTITVKDAKPVGGVKDVTVNKGGRNRSALDLLRTSADTTGNSATAG